MVDPTNPKMPTKLAAKMKYDLDRWQRGGSNCDTTMLKPSAADAPAPAAPARAQTNG